MGSILFLIQDSTLPSMLDHSAWMDRAAKEENVRQCLLLVFFKPPSVWNTPVV